tara:strand:+ start:215 stop:433 length:219 start_codon:yes stop_codon:yes gene_type:complete
MARTQSKTKLDLVENFTDGLSTSTYMFMNKKRNLQVYVDADGWQDAENKFDTCQFEYPNDWEIYLKLNLKTN